MVFKKAIKFGAGVGAGFLLYAMIRKKPGLTLAGGIADLVDKSLTGVKNLIDNEGERAVKAIRVGLREARRKETELNEKFKKTNKGRVDEFGKEKTAR